MGLFVKKRGWRVVFLALLSTAAKVVVDCLSALPEMQRFFFACMGELVQENIRHQLTRCLAQYGASRP
jgi:hypothetical protein